MSQFPFPEPPPSGIPLEIAEGIFWVRLALPFQLDHVNLYLLKEADGWFAVDAGVDNPQTRAAWQELLAFIGGPSRLKRLLVTHHHVDHVGAAGWLENETGCKILMSRIEHQLAVKSLAPEQLDRRERMQAHLRWLGCAAEEAETLTSRPFRSSDHMGPLPDAITFIAPGDEIRIGGRNWQALSGQGHSPAPTMLHSAADNLLLAGDQILSTISPFVGTFGDAPLASPLRDYLAFLDEAAAVIPGETLILPGHGLPFRGVKDRIAGLKAHHAERCGKIVEECRTADLTTRDLIDKLFTRSLDGVMAMALAETLSHVNLLVDSGELGITGSPDMRRFTAPSPR
jgi:glyoxylase-like metal-dependent hydrolase (beta-lactamase superfamily II)